MPIRLRPLLVLGAGTLLAGCSMLPFGEQRNTAPVSPRPIAAAPTGSVSAVPLPPPPGATDPASASGLAALDPALRDSGAAPAVSPAAGTEVARTDMIGSWSLSAAGDSCQLSMVLTTWTGGYRASTRGCTNEALKGISAWNLEGQQVQLFNDSGATVARLYPSSKTQFNGQTQGGGPISVSR